ncbi:hypothetical protein [Winogradskyella wandonensis]|nr:hypothetical protein [Winogradskyella wandonensis]
METLVATVLIVVIFMLASMILNNLFSNIIKSNTRAIDTYISELKYLYINDKISLPYQTDFNPWSIEIFDDNDDEAITQPMIEAFNTETKQTLTQPIFETK